MVAALVGYLFGTLVKIHYRLKYAKEIKNNNIQDPKNRNKYSCNRCGAPVDQSVSFCAMCEKKSSSSEHIEIESIITDKTTSAPFHTGVAASSLKTKWLKFWNYFSLPTGGVLGLLMSLVFPALGIILAPLAILQFIVVYGLHHRRLWAWKWNWVLIIIHYIGMAIPRTLPGTNISDAELVAQFVIRAVIGGLIWMWPNHVYWKKRRALFS